MEGRDALFLFAQCLCPPSGAALRGAFGPGDHQQPWPRRSGLPSPLPGL